jgi:putative chitinase
MTTWITEHFSLEELTTTQVRRFSNTPPPSAYNNLVVTAQKMELVRAKALRGAAVVITSGYRSPGVNAAVGGRPESGHLKGYCLDFLCPTIGNPLAVCRAIVAAKIPFDQLIEEGGWTHISFDPRMRGEVMTKTAAGHLVHGLTPA